MMTVLLLLIGGFVAVLLHMEHKNLKQSSLEKLGTSSAHLEESLIDQSKMLTALEEGLVREATLIEALKAQDGNRLLADYGPLFNRLRTEYGYIRNRFSGMLAKTVFWGDLHGNIVSEQGRQVKRRG